ncbi:hypothetical protein A6B39_03820 [Mannheimia granulomatis]|uniref:DUF554 domain-containing protein n=1 Tax=Mannheimia granulomatis TaxID=85402 RepID=UPI00159DDE7E|nr:DUF554 domain-containing protein [Mannheimia granulomatis]QLB14641.1 hypothetical protein A6B39_03820 [Mannheimia granulomatis]
MIGPFVNAGAVILGGILGAYLGSRLPERLRTTLPLIFGLCCFGLSIMLTNAVQNMSAVVLALITGTIIGELIYLEKLIGNAAGSVRGLIDRFLPPTHNISQEEFLEKFIAILVLFCVSGTGIFGAMKEGMTGDPTILYIKSILDFFTAMIFAATLGYAVATIAIPLVLIQGILVLLATVIMPLTTANMMADFSAVGGLLLFATGFRICGIKMFPVANMLPALLLAMPISYLWEYFIK